MPLHDYVKKIYEEVKDPSYIVRFISYLINTRYKKVTISANGITADPLITGVLEERETKKRFYSFSQFYNYATGAKTTETDISVLAKLFVTTEYSIMRIICNAKEADILNFFDQRYRTFLMYRDVRKRIKFYTLKDTNSQVTLQWKDNIFTLDHTTLTCDKDKNVVFKLLETYENGYIDGLYYCTKDTKYIITDT
jgi:hypothetical protein